MTHGNLTSFEWVVLSRVAVGRTRWSAFFSSVLATSVAMETWSVENRVFVYDMFVKRRVVTPLALPIFQRVIFSFGGI